MKSGYKHKTGTFGTDGELFASRLFEMVRQPHGTRRPDLVSLNGSYLPRLAIEMKSGLARKGVLVEYQLHYSIQTNADYRKWFGEDPPARVDSLPGIDTISLDQQPTAFYYDMLERVDGVPSAEINTPFAAIRCKWGDHHIVPGEYGFWAFVAARSVRTGKSPRELAKDIKETMKRNILEERSNYSVNKDSQSWQDLHGRDVLARFHGDDKLTTKHGKERVRLIAENYPRIKDLVPIKIDAPNDTTVYVLALPEHRDLFDKQMRRVVNRNKTKLETVTRSRRKAIGLLSKLQASDEAGELFGNGFKNDGEVPEEQISGRLTKSEIMRLNRLTQWLARGEKPIEEPAPF